MNDRAAILNAIRVNPLDDTIRSAFADWLRENGESERADFIQAQLNVERRRDERGDLHVRPARQDTTRASSLWDAHGGEW